MWGMKKGVLLAFLPNITLYGAMSGGGNLWFTYLLGCTGKEVRINGEDQCGIWPSSKWGLLGYNPLTNLLLTSWHILVDVDWNPLKSHMGPWSADAIHRRLLLKLKFGWVLLFTNCIEGPNTFGEIVLGKYVQFPNKTRSKDLWDELILIGYHPVKKSDTFCKAPTPTDLSKHKHINIQLEYSRDTVSRQIDFQKLEDQWVLTYWDVHGSDRKLVDDSPV